MPVRTPSPLVIARLVLLALMTLLSGGPSLTRAQVNNGQQKRVLVLHLMRRNDTSTLTNDRQYQKVLSDGLHQRLDYYGEYVDLTRFGTDDYQAALRDFLKQKYKGIDFNLVIAVTADMRNFMARFGRQVFPNAPVVFSSSDDRVDKSSLPPNFTGIVSETNLRGTLDVIRDLQPAVRRVFIITGASQAVDKWHEARARRQFNDYGHGLELTYWSGLTIEELKHRISNLTPDSVVYFLMMVEDGNGVRFAESGALDQLAAVSSVPIYTWYDGFLDHGVVGGKLASSANTAAATAELALRVLRGEQIDSLPIVRADTSRLALDWRQLRRWNLNERKLPADAELLFVEPTFWQRYQNRIIIVIALLAVQSALIVALLIERRRRRKANRGLKQSEERYRNVVETQTELICRFLPDTTLTFVNGAYCKYFGRTADDLIGRKFIYLIPDSDRQSTLKYLASLLNRSSGGTWEHPVIRPNGGLGWQQWTNSVISTGSDTNVELQGVGRDISERKRLEQQLISSERQFSTLVQNSPDVICRLDRNLRYTYASPNVRSIFGVGAETFLKKCPADIAVPDYNCNELESMCREAIDTGRSTVHEFQYLGRHYRTRIIPEYSNGEIESVISISEDITQQLRSELELRKLTTRLLKVQDEERRRIGRELHDGATQNISAITLNLRRLQQVTNAHRIPGVRELLDDSQVLAKQSLSELRTLSYLLHPPILDQAGLVQALRWFVRGFSERTGIHVDDAAVQQIGRLPSDIETALFRIAQESLTNVHRHSGSETAIVRLERRSTEVQLQISDHGHGMTESTTLRSDAELGVGISGMRERLTQLGGRLQIDSGERGTTVTVVVPALQEAVQGGDLAAYLNC